MTEEKLNATYEAIDKVMALASAPLVGAEQIEFEMAALSVYLGAQIGTLPRDEQGQRIADLARLIRECIDARAAAKSVGKPLKVLVTNLQ